MSKPFENIHIPPVFISRSLTTTEANKTGSWRFLRPRYDEKTAPCSAACPAGEDIGRIEMLATQGLFKEAWETILQENPFPAVCGRVCYHPCEGICNRKDFDEAVAIHVIERFLSDVATRYDLKTDFPRLPSRRERIAVIGSGPSGLAAAHFLARMGYACDVFEALSEPGGVLRWGIPTYRLPEVVLKKEIARIKTQGVSIHCGKRIGRDFLHEAREEYHAVFWGCGHGKAQELSIPGVALSGVMDGLAFLEGLRLGKVPRLEGTVAVVGGGNTAIDVARSALRLGAKVLLIYRRRRQDMPAFPNEVAMALEEGMELIELHAPVQIASADGGWLLSLQEMKILEEGTDYRPSIGPVAGKVRDILVSQIFAAIGAEPAEEWLSPPGHGTGVLRLSNSTLMVQDKGPVVVYGGDLTSDIKSVVHAVASGKEAAMALDVLFREGFDAVESTLAECRVGGGHALSMEIFLRGLRCKRNPHVVAFSEINTDHFTYAPRIVPPRLLWEERVRTFAEIDLKISANLAMQEAGRCFNCGLCNQCDNCRLFCPEVAVHREDSPMGRIIDYDYCKGCGVCVVECPRHAMSLEPEQAS